MSNDSEKIVKILSDAASILSLAVEVGHPLYKASIAISSLARRAANGDIPTDEELEKVYGSEYPLKPFHDDSNFKSYNELKEKMERVLGEAVDNRTAEQVASDMDVTEEAPFDGGKPITGGTSDTMDYFEKLATA